MREFTKNPTFHKLWKVGKYCGIIPHFIVECHISASCYIASYGLLPRAVPSRFCCLQLQPTRLLYVAAPVDTTAASENAAIENVSSENAATENAATEVPAKSESNATAENAEATADSAVAQ